MGRDRRGVILFEPDGSCALPVGYKGGITWTKVDPDVAVWACEYNWHLAGYATCYVRTKHQGRFLVLHQIVNETPPGMVTDHVNRRSLDNRRCNLRSATKSQNAINHGKRTKASSRWRGVSRHHGRWVARLRHQGKLIQVGSFENEADAATAYNLAAYDLFGSFAAQNSANS